MKQHPILFSGPMVRAILDGRKTQTRRAGKIQNPAWTGLKVEPSNHATKGVELMATYNAFPGKGTARWGICTCPYGVPGDRLWVREEFYQHGHWQAVPGVKTKKGRQKWQFVPTDGIVRFDTPSDFRKGRHSKDPGTAAWHKRLARFMPRTASRIALEIVSVRVERLQDITEADAIAEGIERDAAEFKNYDSENKAFPWIGGVGAAKLSYWSLWDTINGCGSWQANPWVWVVEFKRVEGARA